MNEERLGEIERLARENYAMLEELLGYKRKIESRDYQSYEELRNIVINTAANLMTGGRFNR